MGDATGLAEVMLGLDGCRVLEVTEGADELVITVETTVTIEGSGRCGTRAKAHDRQPRPMCGICPVSVGRCVFEC
jgi:hypothetical protein